MKGNIRKKSIAFGRSLYDIHYRFRDLSNGSVNDRQTNGSVNDRQTSTSYAHDGYTPNNQEEIKSIQTPVILSPNSTLLNSTISSSRRTETKTNCTDFDTVSISSSVSIRKGPNFQKINAAHVRIKSLRNKINKTENIDEITNMMAEVLTLENEILNEKTKGQKLLESKKKAIEEKIEKLSRGLFKLEDELSIVDMELHQKTEKARADLAIKIKILESEYNAVNKKLEQMCPAANFI
jgi:hypothetical protein